MLGPWAPNACFIVRRETMHHDHHTRARDRPTDPTRPGPARFGIGLGLGPWLCGVDTYIFRPEKLDFSNRFLITENISESNLI